MAVGQNVVMYRFMAYVTGTVLIVLCVFTVLQFFTHVAAVVNAIGIVHGLLYIGYLLVAYPLTRRLKLGIPATLGVLLAGTVPVMTFVVEHRIRVRYIVPALAAAGQPAAGVTGGPGGAAGGPEAGAPVAGGSR